MPKVRFLPDPNLCPEGAVIEAKPGDNICELALKNNIQIEHACELSCACTTCHVFVREGFDDLDEADELEEDFLDKAFAVVNMNWKDYVVFDERYLRPTEVDMLIGDSSKAKHKLGWEAKTSFDELVKIMVESDLKKYNVTNKI